MKPPVGSYVRLTKDSNYSGHIGVVTGQDHIGIWVKLLAHHSFYGNLGTQHYETIDLNTLTTIEKLIYDIPI